MRRPPSRTHPTHHKLFTWGSTNNPAGRLVVGIMPNDTHTNTVSNYCWPLQGSTRGQWGQSSGRYILPVCLSLCRQCCCCRAVTQPHSSAHKCLRTSSSYLPDAYTQYPPTHMSHQLQQHVTDTCKVPSLLPLPSFPQPHHCLPSFPPSLLHCLLCSGGRVTYTSVLLSQGAGV